VTLAESRAGRIYTRAVKVGCPFCGAAAGHRCYIVNPVATVGPAISSRPHQARLDAAAAPDEEGRG
jgi:hypothetical protein